MTNVNESQASSASHLAVYPIDSQPTEGGISLVAVLTSILRHRFWVFGSALMFAALVGFLTILKPRTYTAAGSFIPQSRGASSAFASAAGLVGLLPIGGDQSQAPQFYADLLTSDELLGAMLDTTFTFRIGSRSNTAKLVDLLEPPGPPEVRRQRAIEALKRALTVKTALKTGVVTFRVRSKYPELSREIAADLLDRLNMFNMQARMARAGTERKFTEDRLATVQAELRAAEDRLQQFMQTNQDFRTSSRLYVLQDQLQREVNNRQAVYTSLAQAYEQARIEEVRNTPVIMVVQHPRAPVFPDPRGLVVRVIASFLAAVVFAALLSLLHDFFWGADPEHEEPAVEEFKAVIRDTVADVKHPIRAIRRSKLSG
jgi:uncharacterized protein involved in exopolysaccharide biosynthesis